MSTATATLPPLPAVPETAKIGIVSISDRASSGVYEDKGLPALKEWLTRALHNPIEFEARLIPDDKDGISATLIELVEAGCSLVLTTGGTGPALRDVTPEATLAVADKEMPGFGEQMRQISLAFVPTAILSRQVAVIRGESLIINLPGQPKAIAETLEGLKDADGADGAQRVPGISLCAMASVASGVTSRRAGPVPPVVSTKLQPSLTRAISAALMVAVSSGIRRASKVIGFCSARVSQSCSAGRPLSS